MRPRSVAIRTVAAMAVATLLGCGLYAWQGHFVGDTGGPYGVGISMTLTQPNPFAVVVNADISVYQGGHATCVFETTGCAATMDLANDTIHASACTIVQTQGCIGSDPGTTFVSDIEARMLTQVTGTVQTFELSFSDFLGGGPLVFPVPMQLM